ncbi:OLC1v1006803C1 [Oldenlandia corymbosa var. corymbosa]|uniref:OLC1v1006803C1 n=1 Tax=Oldenlandia corymbosa var. corymbosa TaxID=529605 RepID=A0AAV1DHU0_OLDCO|nr:OLC1v1006803C1 [Oldenlandia corymbosa var. corymbosa]
MDEVDSATCVRLRLVTFAVFTTTGDSNGEAFTRRVYVIAFDSILAANYEHKIVSEPCLSSSASPYLSMTVFSRYSTVPESLHEPLQDAEFLSFLQSTLDEEKGCSHHWINRSGNLNSSFKKDGIFLIVAGKFFEDSHYSGTNNLISLQKVKLLQQRYPSLQIIGFQPSSSISTNAADKHLLWRIMADFITFPVLLSNKYHHEMEDSACYLLFKGFGSPSIYHEKDINAGNLEEAVKSITSSHVESSRAGNKLDSPWANPIQIMKEPYYTSSLRNLFLCFPACISVDEDGKRLFLSDSNHHRIFILDADARILDVIGSSPGFEDSEFENSKLMRPAASFYHPSEDCLYFVDSENHAIRRADLERRVVETIYPTNTSNKDASLWSWVLEKFGKKSAVDAKSVESHSDLLFPWHLLKSSSNDLFILNQSFNTLWVVDMTSGDMKQVVKGFQSILETCGQIIMEKSSVMKHIPDDWLQQMSANRFLDGVPHGDLICSIAKLNGDVIFCDAAGQMVYKLNGDSGAVSSFQFSNFGILGLPYWFSFPLEKVCADDNVLADMHIDHVEGFSLLPGRVSISVKVAIPVDMDLVEPLSRSSVWCQARGTAMEISGVESKAEFSEKVGVAQQWYDEIDHLPFTTSEKESNALVETSVNRELQDGRGCFDCAIATSPGTSEIIIIAPLYLRLKRNSSLQNQAEKASRILDILDPLRKSTRNSVIQFLLSSKRDLEELIFVKCLHLRLKFDSSGHPKADNSKGVVLTDSSVEVKVAF